MACPKTEPVSDESRQFVQIVALSKIDQHASHGEEHTNIEEPCDIVWTVIIIKRQHVCLGAAGAFVINQRRYSKEEVCALRSSSCAVCGTQNLYPIQDLSGDWSLEPHSVAGPRLHTDAAFLVGE
jgi:hypothetical protein